MEVVNGKRVNMDVARRDFKYYIFDWDDNILHMPTRIYLEKRMADGTWKPVSVSTGTYALVRFDGENYRMPPDGGRMAAFRDFQDSPDSPPDDKAFIRDTKAALARIAAGDKPGPSFETMRKTLREGRIFAIVTARGHEPETIRRAVRLFIDEALSQEDRDEMLANLRGYRAIFDKAPPFADDEDEISYYLSVCRYHAVTHPDFKEMMAADGDFGERLAEATSEQRPELAKEFAIRDFVEHLMHMLQHTGGLDGKHHVAVGFSDDDAGNVKAVSRYIKQELSRRFGSFKFVVYDTSDPTLANGRKVTVAGQMDLPGF